ncbi:putative O-methylsterigmatocystin oxidoreductase [Mollisia scopiformis]|uniref:Putative O-methylsterigmatocystin oxidoreductase n=1 Tax=Mollisia scopiformis TaxID=149040 RepID=A0A132BEI5_MOLSC|nr:putative O-methylsterigmatocystin oxidoreductase [Mollisia scopiformis]KUJ10419.1 putative O-methylsterigmatocystin oxidoreductase [Mollisia scopiformis]
MEFPLSSSYAALFSIAGLALVLLFSKIRGRKSLPYPPGPPGEFLIGHLRVVPFEDSHTAYLNWGKEYNSDVLYFNTLRQPIVVLNSQKAAKDLLDNRGSIYSDRPKFELLKLLGWGMTLTWLRWGPKMQQHRKILQTPFTKSKISQYQNLQLEQTHHSLRGILENPLHWELELKRLAIAITAEIGYGVKVDSVYHPWVKLSDDAGYATSHAGAPGGSLVDRFPPGWLPGLHSVKYAHDNKFAITNIHDIPYNGAVKEMEKGLSGDSFIHNLLYKYRMNEKAGLRNEFTLADIKGSAGAIIIAGSKTTMTTLVVFVLMMMCNPEIQRKAQAEIDAAIGSERLPGFDDLERLTYLNYIKQEVFRIAPLSPLGIPHVNLTDDTYNGMFIPKGSIIYQNVYAMHRDESIYSNPYEFDPDRYIPKDQGRRGEPFPNGNFGWGRRVCPGQFLANNTLSLVMATFVSTLNIDWPMGPSGKPTPFTPEWSKIGLYHPKKFQCSIEPRRDNVRELALKTL